MQCGVLNLKYFATKIPSRAKGREPKGRAGLLLYMLKSVHCCTVTLQTLRTKCGESFRFPTLIKKEERLNRRVVSGRSFQSRVGHACWELSCKGSQTQHTDTHAFNIQHTKKNDGKRGPPFWHYSPLCPGRVVARFSPRSRAPKARRTFYTDDDPCKNLFSLWILLI